MADLEAIEARRDDMFALLCRNGGSPEEWDELNRLTLDLRANLCDRLEAWSRERRRPDSPHITIDHDALEAWYESQSDIPY
jgi:hypothetical protein